MKVRHGLPPVPRLQPGTTVRRQTTLSGAGVFRLCTAARKRRAQRSEGVVREHPGLAGQCLGRPQVGPAVVRGRPGSSRLQLPPPATRPGSRTSPRRQLQVLVRTGRPYAAQRGAPVAAGAPHHSSKGGVGRLHRSGRSSASPGADSCAPCRFRRHRRESLRAAAIVVLRPQTPGRPARGVTRSRRRTLRRRHRPRAHER